MNEWLISLDPDPEDLADALFHFLTSQDWYEVTLLLDESIFSGSVSRRLLALSNGPPLLKIIKLPPARSKLLSILSSCHTSKTRVLVLCCSGGKRTRQVFQEARKIKMLEQDWIWIVMEKATSNPESGNYPVGILGLRLKHQVTNKHSVRSAMDVVAESAKYLDGNFQLVGKGNESNISCWNNASAHRRRVTEALHTVIKRQLERESAVAREGLEPPVFEILNLVSGPHSSRRRWKRLGNVTGSRVHMDAVVWLRAPWSSGSVSRRGGPLSRPPAAGGRQRFRVVTAYSPPFVKPGTRVENGSCLIGVPCLQVNTSDKDAIVAIFADYHAGRSEGMLYNITCCAGISIALLLALSRDLGFEFDLYLVADGFFGTMRGKEWNGITADLVSGAAHMTFAAFSMTSARQQVIDFSVPYFHSGVSCLTSSQYRVVPLSAFLVPFSIQLWVAIFCGLTATAVAAAVYEWLSPFGLNPWGRQRTKNFSLASALWVMWSLLFSHLVAFKAPKSWPNKVLINIWGCFSVIFLASYTANIAALFAGLFFHLRVDDFHDAQLLNLRTGTARGSAAEFYVHKENPELYQHIQRYGVDTLEMGLQELRNKELDMLIGDTAVLNYFRGNDPGCSLHLLADSIFDDAYAVGVQKDFPLTEAISEMLLKYSEYGYVDQLQKKWYGRVPCFDDRLHRFNQPEPLSVEAVAGVFIMLLVGVGVGVLILILEHVIFRYALPILRKKPKECIWRSPNLMFFSQKLYRFINTVELVSPHHSVKEIISNLKEGQIASLFQKSVKKKFKEEARRRKSKSQFFDMIQEIRRAVRQQNDTRTSITWEDSRTQLTSPPVVTTPLEGEVPWEIDENEAVEEEESDDDDDDENRFQIPEIRFTSSFQDLTQTSVLLHSYRPRYYSESPEEPDSLVESYSSTSTATFFNRVRTRLSASASDLTSMQVKDDPWLKIGVLTSPRVRSLDDIQNLRKDSLTSENKERIESLEFADNLSATWRSSYTIDELRLLSMSKEDIVRMWQGSERALLNRLQDTLKEKRLLEQKLAFVQKTLLKPP
ncbi:Glutamate receptor ionotropic like protein [Argiope bruennichi]|uniref:Glutamate receptor ionotropic like protein n=2 Tax=Argiope bruennichi TaxID=94029 RepID=A0A8T0E5V0_ARGBR|nr:Glutamate receptor ionotropic like protein [Argiope bruennichi]